MRVVITGAGGNLGRKLAARLQAEAWCETVLGIDVSAFAAEGKVTPIVADLRDGTDRRWIEAVAAADAVVHFAAENPFPDASWLESAHSFDMTANLLEHAGRRSCRFVFASSNHAMGAYKDAPLPAGGKLGGETPPLPGTRFYHGQQELSATAYGASKLLGERALLARAAGSGGRLTGVATRIGWCQKGENRPQTISTGDPAVQDRQSYARDLTWFRNMWLSDADFLDLYVRALRAPAEGWPAPAIVVSGMSNNTGMAWDLEAGRRYLGYEPQDDVWRALAAG